MDVGVDFHGRLHKGMARQLAKLLEPHQPMFIEGEIRIDARALPFRLSAVSCRNTPLCFQSRSFQPSQKKLQTLHSKYRRPLLWVSDFTLAWTFVPISSAVLLTSRNPMSVFSCFAAPQAPIFIPRTGFTLWRHQ